MKTSPPHPFPLDKKDPFRLFLLEAALASAGGFLIYLAWEHFSVPTIPWRAIWEGIPRDGVWREVFALGFPLIFLLFGAVHLILNRLEQDPQRQALLWKARRKDLWLLLALPAAMLVLMYWTTVGDWYLALGILFLGLVFFKTGWLVWGLYEAYVKPAEASIGLDPSSHRAFSWGLVIVPFAAYALLGFWINHAISTTGDEHVYLLGAHSLWADQDMDIRNNIQQKDYASFYWARWHPGAWEHHRFLGYPLLLLPGYALLGRFGALLTHAILAALLLHQLFRLVLDVQGTVGTAFAAWVGLFIASPLAIYTTNTYPELPAALLVLVGYRGLQRVDRRMWGGVAIVVACVAALALLKERYMPLGAGLILLLLFQVGRRFPRWILPLLGGLVGLGALVLFVNFYLYMIFPGLYVYTEVIFRLGDFAWNRYHFMGGLGLFFDQEFGLFLAAPVLLLAFPGCYFLCRRRWDHAAMGLLLMLGYLGVLLTFRVHHWEGGWSPPARFLIPVLPIIAFWAALGYGTIRNVYGRILALFLLCLSLAYTVVTTLKPIWRYGRADGVAAWMGAAETSVGLDMHRFLPSLVVPGMEGWVMLGILIGGVMVVLVPGGVSALGTRWRGVLAGVPLVWLGVILLGLAAGQWVPALKVEAEAMTPTAGVLFSGATSQPVVWVFKTPGSLEGPVVLRGGPTRFDIEAAGHALQEGMVSLALKIDGQQIGTVSVVTGEGKWIQGQYSLRASVPGGYGRLELSIAHMPPRTAVYVDRVRISRAKEIP